MPKARLDQTYVTLAYCEAGRAKTDYYDETVTGFVLECRFTGGKTYYLRYADPRFDRSAKGLDAQGGNAEPGLHLALG